MAASLVLPRFPHSPENLAASFLPLPPEREEVVSKESVHECQGCMELNILVNGKCSELSRGAPWNRRPVVAREVKEKELGMAGSGCV